MATFHLKVLTVDKQFFDGEVDRIVVRTSQGDVGILPNHVPYVAALGVGGLTIIRNGERRVAADREMDIAQGKLKKAVNRIRIAESK